MKYIYKQILVLDEASIHHWVWKIVIWSGLIVQIKVLVDFKVTDYLPLVEDQEFEKTIAEVWQTVHFT
jgi:hypothetical protein